MISMHKAVTPHLTLEVERSLVPDSMASELSAMLAVVDELRVVSPVSEHDNSG